VSKFLTNHINVCIPVNFLLTPGLVCKVYTPCVGLIKMTPFTDMFINFRAFYHLSVKLNKLINSSCAWYALMWTVEWKIRQLDLQLPMQPLGTPITMLIMWDTELGFNKNVIIIQFEEFIDLLVDWSTGRVVTWKAAHAQWATCDGDGYDDVEWG